MSAVVLQSQQGAYATDPLPQSKVNAGNLQTDVVNLYGNDAALKAGLDVITRDDGQLRDAIVRLRCLHPEVIALIGSLSGWKPKVAVACMTTGNIALAGEQSIDGVATSFSRVFVRAQTNGAENGIYLSAPGAWARTSDALTADQLGYSFIPVVGGTLGASTTWICTLSAAEITVDTTALTWTELPTSGSGGGGGGTPGVGITWRGVWTITNGYAINDAVYDNGSSYICKLAHTAGSATEPSVGLTWQTYWDLMVSGTAALVKTDHYDAAGAETPTTFIAGSTTQLTMTGDPGTEDNTDITFNGLVQHKSTYSVAGTVVTFSSPIPGDVTEIEIVRFPTVPFTGTAQKVTDRFVTGTNYTPGVTTTLALSGDPGGIENTLVTFNGVTQHKVTYTVAANIVTFTSPIPTDVSEIEIARSPTVPYATLPDGIVTEPKLANQAVSTRTIQPNAVDLSKLNADVTAYIAAAVSTAVAAAVDEFVPIGKTMEFSGAVAPSAKWLLEDGASYLRATYPGLFAVIGTTHGSVDGTHFNVPDSRGRTAIGTGTGTALNATAHALGQKSGAEAFALDISEVPIHTHTIDGQTGGPGGDPNNVHFSTHAGGNVSRTSGGAGGIAAHNNMQPYIAKTKFIRAL